MASYDKSIDSEYTRQVQQILSGLGADLGAGGVDGKWGAYTQSAYEQNREQVEAILSGGSSHGASNIPALSYTYVEVPQSNSYEYYYSIGDALQAAQYERQKQQAENSLQGAQAALESDLKGAKAGIESSATARGFGRSTYVVDSLQYADNAATAQRQSLLDSFSQTLLYLDAERHSSAASYASSNYQAQENRIYQANLQNAQMANEQALNLWKAQLAQAENTVYGGVVSSSGSGSRKSSSSSSASSSSGASSASSAASSAQGKVASTPAVSKQTIKVR